jgi:hypothetical protein
MDIAFHIVLKKETEKKIIGENNSQNNRVYTFGKNSPEIKLIREFRDKILTKHLTEEK